LYVWCFREKEALSVKLDDLKAELLTVTAQRDELEKSNQETRLQVIYSAQTVNKLQLKLLLFAVVVK